MTIFAAISALVFAILGGLHLIYTVHDIRKKPRYFRPKDTELLDAMRATKTAIAPEGRDYWSGILGFHLSHSIGVLLFALLIVIAAQYPIGWLKPLLVGVGMLFALISWRFWFRVPMLGCLIGTGLMIVAWSL